MSVALGGFLLAASRVTAVSLAIDIALGAVFHGTLLAFRDFRRELFSAHAPIVRLRRRVFRPAQDDLSTIVLDDDGAELDEEIRVFEGPDGQAFVPETNVVRLLELVTMVGEKFFERNRLRRFRFHGGLPGIDERMQRPADGARLFSLGQEFLQSRTLLSERRHVVKIDRHVIISRYRG